jgi:predicted dinucleotide-binding enzyme
VDCSKAAADPGDILGHGPAGDDPAAAATVAELVRNRTFAPVDVRVALKQ